MGSVRGPSDGELAALAGRYRDLTHEQLRAAGLSDEAIKHRVKQGRLRRIWRDAYLVGPSPPHPLAFAHAATAAGGFVSHAWAACAWGFAPAPPLPVDVTVIRGSRRGRPGKVLVHRSRILEPRDVTTRHGIPVTSPARALLDIAVISTLAGLERLVADAQVAQVVTEAQIKDVLDRAGRHRGAPRLRLLLADHTGITLSEAERILRRLLRDAGIEQPVTNHPVGRYRADFAWPAYGLIVEFDSFGAHGHRRAFHHDRRRNAELAAAGWSVLPVTWEQIRDEPLAVAARIASALAVRAQSARLGAPYKG